jgi:GT2 family glycosyltransferase
MNAGTRKGLDKLLPRAKRTEQLGGAQPSDEPPPENDGFDEERYLTAFPDIAEAVAKGLWASGRAHYYMHGAREGRLIAPAYLKTLTSDEDAEFPACSLDISLVSPTGWCLIIGWIDDEARPLRAVALSKNQEIIATTDCIARCRREDAEADSQAIAGKLLGFWAMFRSDTPLVASTGLQMQLWVGNNPKIFDFAPQRVDDQQLRDRALEYLVRSRYFANFQLETFRQLGGGLGGALVRHNLAISREIIKGAHVMRFGDQSRRLDGSIVVCLFGRPEYVFLQASAFSACRGMERYEFVYVSNSPELAERLAHEAAMATRIYGVSITLVILPSNAGFGAANNVAVEHARSTRILIVNPDVFPRDRDWATHHTNVVSDLPAEQTKLFGVPLYYDDGSLMHGGMYFEFDGGVSIHDGRIEQLEMIRVEHYGKGAPPETQALLHARPVPAVTGAFMSIDRSWFEALGGFTLDYIFGHYEDADLCLRSLQQGQPTWMHRVPFWHLEGKGSERRPAHDGASLVNRWHFTNAWRDFILAGLLGKSPQRFLSMPVPVKLRRRPPATEAAR